MLKDQVNGADGLDGARSIVLTPDGKFAYLAAAADHSLGWFDRNASSGALTFLGILKDGVNGVEGLQNASHFILSHDEKQVYGTLDGEGTPSAGMTGTLLREDLISGAY